MKQIILLFIFHSSFSFAQNIEELMEKGELSKASILIKNELSLNDSLSQNKFLYYRNLLQNIELLQENYPYTIENVYKGLKKQIKNLTIEDILNWERNNSLEYIIVDGQKKYFRYYKFNLFQLNSEAYNRKINKDSTKFYLKNDLLSKKKNILEKSKISDTPYMNPKTIKVNFTFFVDVTDIPQGQIVRGWIPYPVKNDKQKNVKIIAFEPSYLNYSIFNDKDSLSPILYVEYTIDSNQIKEDYNRTKNFFIDNKEDWITPLKSFDKLSPQSTLIYRVQYEYTSYQYYHLFDPNAVSPYDTSSYIFSKFTKQEKPEIEFTDYLKELSKSIVNKERNPLLKAKNIYDWISYNFIWVENVPVFKSVCDFTAKYKKGDCGRQSLLFITLCRLNGIPARTQGGWSINPNRNHSQHTWSQIYIEPYGWLTVDVDAGRNYYSNGLTDIYTYYFCNYDGYRLILYDNSTPLFPLNIYENDSGNQLGAFEWIGGNLKLSTKIDSYVHE